MIIVEEGNWELVLNKRYMVPVLFHSVPYVQGSEMGHSKWWPNTHSTGTIKCPDCMDTPPPDIEAMYHLAKMCKW